MNLQGLGLGQTLEGIVRDGVRMDLSLKALVKTLAEPRWILFGRWPIGRKPFSVERYVSLYGLIAEEHNRRAAQSRMLYGRS